MSPRLRLEVGGGRVAEQGLWSAASTCFQSSEGSAGNSSRQSSREGRVMESMGGKQLGL